MDQPIAYLNGQFLPADQAALPLDDAGFALGATVTEQLRTFGGRLFRLESASGAAGTFAGSLRLAVGHSRDELVKICERLVAENHRLLDPTDDLGLVIFVTPGP